MTKPKTLEPIVSDDDPTPVRPQPQPVTLKSKVIAEFVDEIPTPERATFRKSQTSWQSQEGFKEGLAKAFNNPGRPMLLVDYDGKGDRKAAPSKRRELARLRAKSLEEQGYSERNGWTVKAVETKVYVRYDPVEDKW